MRRTIVLTQEELDDIDDNKWRRKSYALAQHNALPVPMPLPVYPPPKPCPPPTLVCRPSRLGVRPPRPGYRPPPGYRPSAGYRPSKTANSLPAMPEVLPTLSEIGPAASELSPGMMNHTPDNSRTSSPLPPHVSTSPACKASSPAPPRTSTFKPMDSPPVLTSPLPIPAGPTSQRTNPSAPQTNVLPTLKSPSSEPTRPTPLPTSPHSGQTNLPRARASPPLGHMNPSSRPTDPPPLPAHLPPSQTNPPPADVNPNSTMTSPPPLPTKPPPLPTKPPPPLKRPPSSQKTLSPQAQTNPMSVQTKPPTTTAHHHPAAQPNLKSFQANPKSSQAEHPPPQTISPSVQTNPPLAETNHLQEQTNPTSGQTNVPSVMADNPSARKSSLPTEMTPPYTQTSHPPAQRNPSPTESNPTSAQTDHPLAPENASITQENPQSTQANNSPEQTNPPVTQIDPLSPLTNHCPSSQTSQSSPQAYHPPVRTNSPSTQTNPQSVPTHPPSTERDPQPAETTSSPQIDPQGAQTDPLPTQTDPLPIQTDPIPRQTDPLPIQTDPLPAQTGPLETEITTSLVSESPTPMTSNLPPTPTSQHFPPTPTSLSRSTTPTSLSCPRTPTSIRAAPWQPYFPTTPLSRSTRTTPTPPCGTPATSPTPSSGTPGASPRPLLAHSQVYPPTPPSSTSHIGVDSVTPASSMSSLSHGHTKTTMNEGEVQFTPDAGDNSSKMSYPAILDVTSLHNDVTNKGTTENGDTAMVEEAVSASGKITPSEELYQTYLSRFWVLAVFSLIAFLQTIVWGTFGPIPESAIVAFPSWTEATIAAFPNWGPIIVVVFTIPMMWLTQKLGLRLGVLTCAVLLTTGTLLRCFPSQELPFTILCHVSSIFFAFAACMTLSLPAMVAATWFPPNERITATAVGALMCQLGGAALYLEPLVVRYPSDNPTDQDIQDIRGDIKNLMYIHFGAAAFLLLAAAIYFPARPDTPPSASSAKEKSNFFMGIKGIIKNPQLLLVLVTYAFSFGVPVVWIGVLNLSLNEIGINQEQSMGVAVTAVVCSAVAAFITARITDKVYGHLRFTIIALLVLSSLFFLWFLLISTQVIVPTLAQVYVSVAGGVCFEYATAPLLVELAVETGYPIPESVIGAALTLLFNLVALVFLGLFQIPDSTHLWVSYVLFACVSLTVLPLMFVKETHRRSDTDRRYIQRES